jgi:hypothetical protein
MRTTRRHVQGESLFISACQLRENICICHHLGSTQAMGSSGMNVISTTSGASQVMQVIVCEDLFLRIQLLATMEMYNIFPLTCMHK